MANVLSMLRRVQRLEQAQVVPRSPFEGAYGSMDAFADKGQGDVAAGKLDGTDTPTLVECVRRSHQDRLWAGWQHHRNGIWYGR